MLNALPLIYNPQPNTTEAEVGQLQVPSPNKAKKMDPVFKKSFWVCHRNSKHEPETVRQAKGLADKPDTQVPP